MTPTEIIGIFLAVCGVLWCMYHLLVEAIAAGYVKGNRMLQEEDDNFWGDNDED